MISLKPMMLGLMLFSVWACQSDDGQADNNSLQNRIALPSNVSLQSKTTMSPVTPIAAKEAGRPQFNDYIDGGTLVKRVRAAFMSDKSFILFYQTRDEFPSVDGIVLLPDGDSFKKITIDSYPFEGGVPQIQDVFFYNADSDDALEMFVICTWDVQHRAIGIDATTYKVYVYDNTVDSESGQLKKMQNLIDRFGDGNEGEMEGGDVTFKYKDREAIIAALKENPNGAP